MRTASDVHKHHQSVQNSNGQWRSFAADGLTSTPSFEHGSRRDAGEPALFCTSKPTGLGNCVKGPTLGPRVSPMMRKTSYNGHYASYSYQINLENDIALGRSGPWDYSTPLRSLAPIRKEGAGNRFQAVLSLVAHMCEPYPP